MLPTLFLTLAEELAQADGPAECRTAVSRAYYAVFNSSGRFLERMGFHRPKWNYHVVLQQRLLSSGDPDIALIGMQLGRLHRDRVQADYHLDDHLPENKNNAVLAVDKAAAMIAILDACPIHGDRWKNARAAIAKANITGTDNLVDLSAP